MAKRKTTLPATIGVIENERILHTAKSKNSISVLVNEGENGITIDSVEIANELEESEGVTLTIRNITPTVLPEDYTGNKYYTVLYDVAQ